MSAPRKGPRLKVLSRASKPALDADLEPYLLSGWQIVAGPKEKLEEDSRGVKYSFWWVQIIRYTESKKPVLHVVNSWGGL